LRAAGKAAGLSQSALAAKAGIGRHAVSNWECKPTIDPKDWAVRKMAEAEPKIADLLQEWATNTRGRETGLTGRGDLQGIAAIRTRAEWVLAPV
jgi:transcriptional regulator with XRE-family HTH domain